MIDREFTGTVLTLCFCLVSGSIVIAIVLLWLRYEGLW